MDNAMSNDYLPELLNNIQQQLADLRNDTSKRFDELNKKTEQQTIKLIAIEKQTLKTNGRVNKLEAKQSISKTLLSPNTLYLLALAGVITLAILATVLKVNFTGLIR